MYAKYAEIRDSKNLTDYRVSELTGIARSTLSDWKNNISTPKADKILAIANVLGVSVADIVEPYKKE